MSSTTVTTKKSVYGVDHDNEYPLPDHFKEKIRFVENLLFEEQVSIYGELWRFFFRPASPEEKRALQTDWVATYPFHPVWWKYMVFRLHEVTHCEHAKIWNDIMGHLTFDPRVKIMINAEYNKATLPNPNQTTYPLDADWFVWKEQKCVCPDK